MKSKAFLFIKVHCLHVPGRPNRQPKTPTCSPPDAKALFPTVCLNFYPAFKSSICKRLLAPLIVSSCPLLFTPATNQLRFEIRVPHFCLSPSDLDITPTRSLVVLVLRKGFKKQQLCRPRGILNDVTIRNVREAKL